MKYVLDISFLYFIFILYDVLFNMTNAKIKHFKENSIHKRSINFYTESKNQKRFSNSWLNVPFRDNLPYYDIKDWIDQLHLQHCAIVEIGEDFCALFVELRGGPGFGASQSLSVLEFFLGVCECAIIREWRLCASSLAQVRLEDCSFQEATPTANSSARIHRRLCDITGMAEWVKSCNCSGTLAKQPLFQVNGFPTCFQSPLPQIMCSSHSPCGLFQCRTNTLYGIHSVLCDPNCQGRQPFCEEVGPITSTPRKVYSYWSEWSTPACNTTCGNGVMYSEAVCVNIASGKAGLDCLGPGAFCCPASVPNCECHLSYNNDFMKVIRTLSPCPALEPCPVEEDDIASSKAHGGRNELFKQLSNLKKEKHPYNKYLNNKHNTYVKKVLPNHLKNPGIKKQQQCSVSQHSQQEIKGKNSPSQYEQIHYRNKFNWQDERVVLNKGSSTSKQSHKKKAFHRLSSNILDNDSQEGKFTTADEKLNQNKIDDGRPYLESIKSKDVWKSMNKKIKEDRFDENQQKFKSTPNAKIYASGIEKEISNAGDGSINEEIYLRAKQLSKNQPATYNLNFKSYFSVKNPAYKTIQKSYSYNKNRLSNIKKKTENTMKYHKRKLLGLDYPEYLINDDDRNEGYYFDDGREKMKHHSNEIKLVKRTYGDYSDDEPVGLKGHRVFLSRDRAEDEDEDTEDEYMIPASQETTTSRNILRRISGEADKMIPIEKEVQVYSKDCRTITMNNANRNYNILNWKHTSQLRHNKAESHIDTCINKALDERLVLNVELNSSACHFSNRRLKNHATYEVTKYMTRKLLGLNYPEYPMDDVYGKAATEVNKNGTMIRKGTTNGNKTTQGIETTEENEKSGQNSNATEEEYEYYDEGEEYEDGTGDGYEYEQYGETNPSEYDEVPDESSAVNLQTSVGVRIKILPFIIQIIYLFLKIN